MRMQMTLVAFVVALAAMSFGQGTCKTDVALAAKSTNGQTALTPAPRATIRACRPGANGTPCIPLATIYTDATLATIAANPFTADANGKFSICTPPGAVYLQETNLEQTITLPLYAIPSGEIVTDTAGATDANFVAQPLFKTVVAVNRALLAKNSTSLRVVDSRLSVLPWGRLPSPAATRTAVRTVCSLATPRERPSLPSIQPKTPR